MANLVSRKYSGENDLPLMLDLLEAVRPAGRVTDYPSIVDLYELLALRKVQDNTRLWLDAHAQVTAFALVDPYNNLVFEIKKRAESLKIEAEIVAWGVECL